MVHLIFLRNLYDFPSKRGWSFIIFEKSWYVIYENPTYIFCCIGLWWQCLSFPPLSCVLENIIDGSKIHHYPHQFINFNQQPNWLASWNLLLRIHYTVVAKVRNEDNLSKIYANYSIKMGKILCVVSENIKLMEYINKNIKIYCYRLSISTKALCQNYRFSHKKWNIDIINSANLNFIMLFLLAEFLWFDRKNRSPKKCVVQVIAQ